MATFVQNNSYQPSVQAKEFDFGNAEAHLRMIQSRYDAGRERLSSLYGSALYTTLSKEENKERREEYIKNIQSEMDRMSKVDLSLEQNVEAASKVFDPLFNDRYFIADASWTKWYQKQQERSQNLKKYGTIGYEKWSEEGDIDLMYQMDRFKKMSLDETLSAAPAEYVADFDIHSFVRDKLKEMDLNITASQDYIMPGGLYKGADGQTVSGMGALDPYGVTQAGQNYVVTKTGGQLVEGDLKTIMFGIVSGDPRVAKASLMKARIRGEQEIQSRMAAKNISRREAEEEYIRNTASLAEQLNMISSSADIQAKKGEERIAAIEKYYDAADTQEEADGLTQIVQETLGNVEMYRRTSDALAPVTVKTSAGELKTLNDMFGVVANANIAEEIGGFAKAYADLTSKTTIAAEPFSLETYKSQLTLSRELAKMKFTKDNENNKTTIDGPEEVSTEKTTHDNTSVNITEDSLVQDVANVSVEKIARGEEARSRVIDYKRELIQQFNAAMREAGGFKALSDDEVKAISDADIENMSVAEIDKRFNTIADIIDGKATGSYKVLSQAAKSNDNMNYLLNSNRALIDSEKPLIEEYNKYLTNAYEMYFKNGGVEKYDIDSDTANELRAFFKINKNNEVVGLNSDWSSYINALKVIDPTVNVEKVMRRWEKQPFPKLETAESIDMGGLDATSNKSISYMAGDWQFEIPMQLLEYGLGFAEYKSGKSMYNTSATHINNYGGTSLAYTTDNGLTVTNLYRKSADELFKQPGCNYGQSTDCSFHINPPSSDGVDEDNKSKIVRTLTTKILKGELAYGASVEIQPYAGGTTRSRCVIKLDAVDADDFMEHVKDYTSDEKELYSKIANEITTEGSIVFDFNNSGIDKKSNILFVNADGEMYNNYLQRNPSNYLGISYAVKQKFAGQGIQIGNIKYSGGTPSITINGESFPIKPEVVSALVNNNEFAAQYISLLSLRFNN